VCDIHCDLVPVTRFVCAARGGYRRIDSSETRSLMLPFPIRKTGHFFSFIDAKAGQGKWHNGRVNLHLFRRQVPPPTETETRSSDRLALFTQGFLPHQEISGGKIRRYNANHAPCASTGRSGASQRPPNPAGKKATTKATQRSLSFRTTRRDQPLHYDLRAGRVDGTLKFLGVTKGTLSSRRQAACHHRGNHPFEYRKFEGTIPEGKISWRRRRSSSGDSGKRIGPGTSCLIFILLGKPARPSR